MKALELAPWILVGWGFLFRHHGYSICSIDLARNANLGYKLPDFARLRCSSEEVSTKSHFRATRDLRGEVSNKLVTLYKIVIRL